MTVPGVYSPEQALGFQGKQTGYRVFSVPGFGGGATWYLSKHGSVVSQHFSESQAQSALRIAERKDAAMQAHVEKVIASDGVDDSRAVEVMARAIACRRWGRSMSNADIEEMLDAYLEDARAALGALRVLEGE